MWKHPTIQVDNLTGITNKAAICPPFSELVQSLHMQNSMSCNNSFVNHLQCLAGMVPAPWPNFQHSPGTCPSVVNDLAHQLQEYLLQAGPFFQNNLERRLFKADCLTHSTIDRFKAYSQQQWFSTLYFVLLYYNKPLPCDPCYAQVYLKYHPSLYACIGHTWKIKINYGR